MNQTPTNEYPNVIAASYRHAGRRFGCTLEAHTPTEIYSPHIVSMFLAASPFIQNPRRGMRINGSPMFVNQFQGSK